MAQVDSSLATALQAEGTIAVATAAAADRWQLQGRSIDVASPFATADGGAAEAGRLASLFDGPIVRDRVPVPGRVRGVTKRCIRLMAAGLDYPPEGALVIVLGAAEQENGTTVLTVLRKLT